MDPYKVLGVSPDADEETVKKAYRALVKKYHPDRYMNTPMQDMATEKLKEINEAYDMITNKKTTNTQQSGYRQWGGAYSQASFDTSFESVRLLIRFHRLQEAEQMLLRLPHNAEWLYLMGMIYLNRGWYERAEGSFAEAVRQDPDNPEYRQAQQGFHTKAESYKTYTTTSSFCTPCGLGSCLCWSCMCSNCCRC